MSENKPRATKRPAAERGWLHTLLLVAAAIACASPLSGNRADADLWGHIQFGRDVLRYGLPHATTYSYTAENYTWINHENLAEISYAVINDSFGGAGLLIFKCGVGLGAIGLIGWSLRRQRVHFMVLCGVLLLVALNLNAFWQVRPQLFSYGLFALLLFLLGHCFTGWDFRWRLPLLPTTGEPAPCPPKYNSARMRRLWLAPLLFLVWANAHGGFAAGLAVLLVYLGLRGVEAWLAWRERSWGILRRLTMMGVASVLATFVNPYGPNLHLWMARSLGAARPEITEWHPPLLLQPIWWPLLGLLLLFFAALLLTRRSRDFTQLAILAALLWQTLTHQRHAPFLAIAFGFWMTPHVESLVVRIAGRRSPTEEPEPQRPGWLLAALSIGCLLMGGVVVNRLRVMQVDRGEYPVAAMQFIARHRLQGNMVATYNWAQYVIGCFGKRSSEGGSSERRDSAGGNSDGPGIRLAFDGRFRTCYPQELVDMHFDLILGDIPHLRNRASREPVQGNRILEVRGTELVLGSRLQPHTERVLRQQRDRWTLLYQDGLAQLWGRRDIFDDPASPRYLPPAARSISDQPQRGFAAWPATPAAAEPLVPANQLANRTAS